MGRKRLPKGDKKIKISVSLKKCNVEKIKEKHSNVSEYIENLVEKDLYRS